MTREKTGARRLPRVDRRAFLRGAGAVTLGLPFLEGLPMRSAWAADRPPVFSLYIVAACGVVGSRFFPDATGALTPSSLAAMTDKATSVLAPHAANLLFIKGVNFPMRNVSGCGHRAGSVSGLDRSPVRGGGEERVLHPARSADMVIAQRVNPEARTRSTSTPATGGMATSPSASPSKRGRRPGAPADDNPYTLYAKLVGLTQPGGASPAAADLLTSGKSVNDLVRAELATLSATRASAARTRAPGAALRQPARC